jgi:glycosyltransferase involved in cell wall biosynthesis
MINRLGIGIITRNRRDILLETIARVERHTLHPATMVVADDGSDDGTQDHIRDRRVPLIAGAQRGVAWNKNRALFYLAEIARCDFIILLEDDTAPHADGWERDWILAAARFGHAGLATDSTMAVTIGGEGSSANPFQAAETAAHCACFSREAIQFGGYFDSRFVSTGFEHVEHDIRLIRHGYGGAFRVNQQGQQQPLFLLLRGAVTVGRPASFVTPASFNQNRQIAQHIISDPAHRMPWRDLGSLALFREEMAALYPRIAHQLGKAAPALSEAG